MINSFKKLYWVNCDIALTSITQRIPCYPHPTTLSSTIELFLMPFYCHKAESLLPMLKPEYKA